MAFTKLNTSQHDFLITHLRGTGKEMTSKQANATYGIKNLRARISEMRSEGFKVRTRKNYEGLTSYAVSRRKVWSVS